MDKYEFFLKRLMEDQREKQKIVKITALSFMEERPQQEIVGRVTGGSVNVNGKSEIRRTCSLTLVADLPKEDYSIDGFIVDEYWALDNKFSLKLGIYNFIEPEYDDIIWFPLGVYIINSFSHSQSPTSVNISISGKDKMCLLDGSINGKFASTMELDTIEIPKLDEDGNPIVDKDGNPRYEIQKTPIKDVIRQLVHTYAKEPYYNILIKDLPEYGLELLSYRGKDPLYLFVQEDGSNVNIRQLLFDQDYLVKSLEGGETLALNSAGLIYYTPKDKLISDQKTPTQVYVTDKNRNYNIMKLQYGDVVGYHQTELIYAGKLTASIGEGVTSALNKIRDQLGQYEYFYDVNGQFVFQRKKNRMQENFSNIISSQGNLSYITEDYYGYEFTDKKLFTAISVTPQISNIKNDFTVQGERKTSGNVKPIVIYRCAIDVKPKYYKNIKGTEYTSSKWDWREIIYQMALDYYQADTIIKDKNKSLEELIALNNPNDYPNGITGYEQYYVEFFSFWRDVYSEEGKWVEEILLAPETLKFWFDFIEPLNTSEMDKISVKKIGTRNTAIKDTAVTGLFYPQVPEVIFYWSDEEINMSQAQAYRFIQVPDNTRELFSLSSRGRSAVEKMQEVIYANAFCNNAINLTSIPIYHLEVNRKIKVDLDSIQGDYIIDTIVIPLTYNGTMTINATKVIDNIY